jgi:tetratricopeptide (TPR) repeat protein
MNQKYQKAHLLYNKGKFKQARELIAKTNRADKYRDVHSVILEAVITMKLNLSVRGEELLQIALKLGPEPNELSIIHFNLFVIYSVGHKYFDATKHMLKALETAPLSLRNEYRLKLAELYFHDREYNKAIEICKKLQVYQEYTIRSLFLIVHCSIELSDFQHLDYYLRQLEARLPEMDKTQLGVLASLIGFHRESDVTKTLARIKAQGAEPNFVNAVHAKHCLNAGNLVQAETVISRVSPTKLETAIAKRLYHETRAQLNLRDNRFGDAFIEFEKMNGVSSQQLPLEVCRQNDHFEQFRHFSKVKFEPNNIPQEQRKKIAFMVGFPRSGTTLLENILDNQAGIVTLSEKPALVDAAKQATLDGFNYPDCFINISDEYRHKLRDVYFERAQQFIGSDKAINDCLLIDKNPLEMIRIPIILSLFPEAKIILAVRHPLDCILSSFMQDFKVSPQLGYFTDLESTFKRYQQLFGLYNQFKQMYNFDDCIIRYEDLVGDLDGTMNGLMDYLQVVSENDDYSQYDKHAQKRVVMTPSASQVRKGIYKQATYRWEKFQEQLRPYHHIVEPYIKQFGYE